jgi:hypothetical protein
VALPLAIAPGQTVIPIDARHTYLRRNSDPAPEATALRLADLGVRGGDVVRLRRLGEFDNGPGGDTFGTMMAVFSGSPTSGGDLARARARRARGWLRLRLGANQHRRACHRHPAGLLVAAGAGATATRNDVVVVVPPGATDVFIVAHDSFYSDNSDPDNDFAVEITVLAPTAWTLLGGGVGGATGIPTLLASGELACGSSIAFDIARAPAHTAVLTVIGGTRVDLPLFGDTLVPAPQVALVLATTDATGSARVSIPIGVSLASAARPYFQHALPDASAPSGIAMTPGCSGTVP